MYKHLMIPMTGSEGDVGALDVAIALAGLHAAHLSVLEMVDLPMPIAHPWGLIPDSISADIHDSLRERGRVNLGKLKQQLASEPISSQARVVEALYAQSPRMAAREAFDADLVVVAGSVGDTVEAIVPHDYFVALLLESGRPVLVIPPRCVIHTPMKRIAIAWQPTRETTRAVHDALPLLKGAERVDVLVVHGEDTPDVEASARRMVKYLTRHGVEAYVVSRPTLGQTVATAILQYTCEMHADVLVAGGYGHSRLREWALGGVTRELLIATDLPMFFGH